MATSSGCVKVFTVKHSTTLSELGKLKGKINENSGVQWSTNVIFVHEHNFLLKLSVFILVHKKYLQLKKESTWFLLRFS